MTQDKTKEEIDNRIADIWEGAVGPFWDSLAAAYKLGVADERARVKALQDNAPARIHLRPTETPAPIEPIEPLPDLVDAATLPPLTPIQFKVFSAVAAAKGQYIPASEIDRRTGKEGSFGSLSGVVAKGYFIGRPTPGRSKHQLTYHVAIFGAPRVLEDGFARRGHKLGKPAPAKPIDLPKPPPAPSPPKEATNPPEVAESVKIRQNLPKSDVIRPILPARAPPPARTRQLPDNLRRVSSVDAPRVVTGATARRLPTDVIPAGSVIVTAQLLGADGNGGAGIETGARGGIKVSTYLSRRGHAVFPARGGWTVDGKFMDRYDVVDVINEHRAKAEMPPVDAATLE